MCRAEAKAPELDEATSEGVCSWALIIAALREQLQRLPADQRRDLEDFIHLLEGIAALRGN
jgi:hypothetical protein